MNNLISTYLTSKIDYYKQEVQYLKAIADLDDYTKQQLQASQEMLDIFIELDSKIKAWEIIKNFVIIGTDNTIEIDAIFANYGKSAIDYEVIKNALDFIKK